MDIKAFQKYQDESTNWLHKSRRDLMVSLLKNALNDSKSLSILEIGAGVGQNTVYLQKLGTVDVVEINEAGIEALRAIPNIRKIITQPIPFNLDESYDIIVAMDVLEHIQNDKMAISWMFNSLRPGGILLLTVPAYQWLFSEHDIALHHFRRYSIPKLNQILPSNIDIIRCGYFNTMLFPMIALLRIYKNFLLKSKKNQTNFKAKKQSNSLPKPLDQFFRTILRAEIYFICKGINPPFGLSIFFIAKRI